MQTDMRLLLYSCFILVFSGAGVRCQVGEHTLIAPQIIREGVMEAIVLNLHGVNGLVSVIASVNLNGVETFNFPDSDATLPIRMEVKYEKPLGAPETNKKQYVELIVTATKGGKRIYQKSLKMLVVESSGYIHVQTDRPIYRPEEVVKIRVIALNQKQASEPERDVEIVIRIPLDNVGVEKKEMRMPGNRFIETSFKLPEYPVFGVWSIGARFKDEKVAKWSEIKFAVRPYVLPTFNVELTLDKQFILVQEDMSEEYITGTITAKYSYGKTVSGSYFLAAKLLRPGFEKPVMFFQLPDNIVKKATISNGKKTFKIKTTKIRDILQKGEGFSILHDEKASVTIEASVTGRAEGVVESDVSPPIVFVVSPYKIDISRTSKYYTPGIPFEIKADVLDSISGKPLSAIEVVLTDKAGNILFELRSDQDGQINEKINMEANAGNKQYKLMTRDFGVPEENEAKVEFTLYPYKSPTNSVLQLSAVRKIAVVGENNFAVDAWFKPTPKEIRYLILARGFIVSQGLHRPKANSLQTNFKFQITADMVPSFRILAYFFHGKEVVSNSLWVDVKDACKKEIEVSVPDEILPGKHFHVEYEGSPFATIGMSAVDRAAYFLYGESRLTKESAYRTLDQYDEGCVREGGKNAQHVFEESGLQLVGGPYEAKEDFTNHCQGIKRSRRKRSVPEAVKAKFENEAILLGCKLDGSLDNLADEDCEERAERVQDFEGYECAEIFNIACKEHVKMKKIGRSSAARAADANAGGFKALAASVRSNFEESMLWRTEQLDGNGKHKQLVIAKDSITTFEFDTVSMHSDDGFCVAETQNMTIFKDIFIQLKVPYALKRREQVEIRASVFNYGGHHKKITVSVKMGKDICSYYPEGKFADIITLDVDPNSAKTASFVMLPLRIPENKRVELEVKATDQNGHLLDQIKKSILVEHEGQIKDIKGTHSIDLKNREPGASQRFSLEFEFPTKYLAGSRQCWIYAYSNFMGPVIEFDPVTKQPKNDIKNIIRMPGGCGEQTMLSMGPNVYAHRYLKLVGKMPDGSAEEQGSIDKMKSGFANELKYRSSKYGVWSVFTHWEPSVWLNAYVNKVFAQAQKFYVGMDISPICKSIEWMLGKQDADGGFSSGGRVIHKEMHGAVGSKLSLTAYVLISLVESSALCPNLEKKVGLAITNAIKYLENNENDATMEQPYTLSLVAYAMTMADANNEFGKRIKDKLMELMKFSEDNRLAFWQGAPLAEIQGTNTHSYWYQRRPLAIDVEATGYALLALIYGHAGVVTQGLLDITRKIVLWLIEQRDENGGFSTTQDTVVGLQALSVYMTWSSLVEPPSKEVKIDLTLRGENGTKWFDSPKFIHLDKENENSTVPINLPADVIGGGRLEVTAEGVGEGSISYRCVYRTLVEEDACHFKLNVTTEEVKALVDPLPGQNNPVILKLLIKLSKPSGLPSGQSIIEINLMSGFEPMEMSLQKLSRAYRKDGSIERYEIANEKVILYLSEITPKELKLAFLLNRVLPVQEPEPSSVIVYDYYEPTVRCTSFYGLPGTLSKLRTTPCKDDKGGGSENMCECAEGGCLTCRTREEQLRKTACLPDMKEECQICSDPSKCHNLTQAACKSNYVYEIEIVKGVEDESGVFVDFEAEILTVYKKGSDFTASDKDQRRRFSARRDCYQSCTDKGLTDGEKAAADDKLIREGRKMLIIGNNVEQNGGAKSPNPEPRYLMDDSTMIERIIPDEKCKSSQNKTESKKCKTLTDKSKPKLVESCTKAARMFQACQNLRLLRRMLIKGCDNPF